jgi:uncharacterized alkaline shock family protein YloU
LGGFKQLEEGQALGFLDRILLFVYSLAAAVLSLLIAAQVLDYDWLQQILYYYPHELLVSALLLFLVSLRFLFFRTGTSREPQAIIQKTEHGDVRISLQTLESLTERAARLVRGVNDLKTRVYPMEGGVRVAVRVTVEPDMDIPQITSTVQQKVKDYLESTAGTTVQKINVHVTDTAKGQQGKGKVQARPRVE